MKEIAKKLLEAGEIEQARQLLRELVSNDQNNPDLWILLCGISTRTKNWQLGVESFGKMVKLKPNNCLVSSGLVQSYLNLNQHNNALQEIERFKLIANNDADDVKCVLEEYQKISDNLI